MGQYGLRRSGADKPDRVARLAKDSAIALLAGLTPAVTPISLTANAVQGRGEGLKRPEEP
jgi:hypothetical protein